MGLSPVTSERRLLRVCGREGVASEGTDITTGGEDDTGSKSDDTRLRLIELEMGIEFSRTEESMGDTVRSIASEDCRFRLPCPASNVDGVGRVGRGDASIIVGRISAAESDGDGILVGVLQMVS